MGTLSPHRHACAPHDIDYSKATDSNAIIKCRVCERVWKPTQYGWRPKPLSKWKPK